MRRFAPLFLFLFSLFATVVSAAQEYIQYSITTKTVTPVAAPADGVAAWALNTADTILFVRDTTQTDASYYIAVFELTHAQAATLGWSKAGADANSNVAFGGFENTGSHPLTAPLAYPTAEQWKAYVENKPKQPCNIRRGRPGESEPRPVTDWLTEYIATGLTACNAYGLYDTYGNVAECTLENTSATPVFYGWYAEDTTNFTNITIDNTAQLKNLSSAYGSVAGVRPIYLPPEEQTYSVTLLLDGQRYSEQTKIAPGTAMTITPPTPAAGYVLSDMVTITPETLAISEAYTFTMPTENVTIAFTSKAQATIVVEGGTVSPQTLCAGDTFTLTADPSRTFLSWTGPGIDETNATTNPLTLSFDTITPGATLTYTATFKPVITIQVTGGTATPNRVDEGAPFTLTATGQPWQVFDHWEGDYGITDRNQKTNPLTLTPTGLATGSTLTYTAVFTSQPRVMVFGGTVKPNVATADFGNGYYAVGTHLTLTPHATAPAGYTFSHWVREEGSVIKDGDYVYTVRANDAVTFTAVYKADETQTNPEQLHIGAVSESTLTTRTAMGYVAATPTKDSYNGNTICYYGTTEASSDYARLDFATKTINLTDTTAETANSEENRSTALVLKRVKPATGAAYYVGIHEVTCAQYETITNQKTYSSDRLLPYVTTISTRHEAATFLEKLSQTFGETFTKPTKTQIETISTGTLNSAQTYGDKAITAAMVNSEEDKAGLLPSGSLDVDPYGFYDLWGNASESFAGDDTNLWGGCYWNAFQYCNLRTPENGKDINRPGAIRAAITVPTRLSVAVTNLEQAFAVLPNQTITLKEQSLPGRRFLGWTVKTETATQTLTTVPTEITITEDTTLTATFSEPIADLTLAYDAHCIGPATALAGTTISIYAVTPEKPIQALTVTPATAATVNLEAGTITFSESATGTVTISTVAPVTAPGFQFRLR